MMKYSLYLLCILQLFIFSCSNEELYNDTSKEGGIYLTLTTGSLVPQSRTQLTSSANLHHVKEVHVFLFCHNDNKNPDNAICVSHQKLDWNPLTDNPNGNQTQTRRFLLENTATTAQGKYTVLCVGLDDCAGATYNLPEAIKINTTHLSEAKAILAQGRTKDDIAHSELFAGWTNFDYIKGTISEVQVEMQRRVAGVLCYLKDIPYELNVNAKDYRVTSIRLTLFHPQNDAISLVRPQSTPTDKIPDDFGTCSSTTTDRECIASFSLEEPNFKADASNKLYQIPAPANRLPNTILMGNYLLPIKGISTKQTLTVDIWGKEKINNEPQGEEICLKSVPAVNLAENDDKYSYSLRPNYIYHIGQKSSPNTTEGDYPESLAGASITVTPAPWTEQSVNVDFPAVPLNANAQVMITLKDFLPQLEGDTYTDINHLPSSIDYSQSFEEYQINPEKYIFDCVNSTAVVRVSPSLLKYKWKMTIVNDPTNPNDNSQEDWIHFQTPEQKFSLEYASDNVQNGQRMDVPIVINDYVNPNSGIPELDKDIRKAYILLETYRTSYEEKPIHTQRIPIQQYNAIIVAVSGDQKYSKRGFSRFDLETNRNSEGEIQAFNKVFSVKGDDVDGNDNRKNPGLVNTGTGLRMGWGYWRMYFATVYTPGIKSDVNGYNNTYNTKNGTYNGSFHGSAMHRTQCELIERVKDNGIVHQSEKLWVLATGEEWMSFFKKYEEKIGTKPQEAISMHVKENEGYWSSNCAMIGSWKKENVRSNLYGTNGKEHGYLESGKIRTARHYLRRVVNIE